MCYRGGSNIGEKLHCRKRSVSYPLTYTDATLLLGMPFNNILSSLPLSQHRETVDFGKRWGKERCSQRKGGALGRYVICELLCEL
jgi:hypothetical protein